MGFNPEGLEECPECGGSMKKGQYLCSKCSYIPIRPAPPLYPELLQYEKPKLGPCERCEMEWLCRIWTHSLSLWALCEIPDQDDLMLMRENGFKKKSVCVS